MEMSLLFSKEKKKKKRWIARALSGVADIWFDCYCPARSQLDDDSTWCAVVVVGNISWVLDNVFHVGLAINGAPAALPVQTERQEKYCRIFYDVDTQVGNKETNIEKEREKDAPPLFIVAASSFAKQLNFAFLQPLPFDHPWWFHSNWNHKIKIEAKQSRQCCVVVVDLRLFPLFFIIIIDVYIYISFILKSRLQQQERSVSIVSFFFPSCSSAGSPFWSC